MFEIHFLAEAESELDEAYEWYEEKQEGLGKRFYNEVNHYIGLIAANPYLFSIKYPQGLRTATLNKFPFLVIFWLDESLTTVYIVSIFHTSRFPKYL